MIDWIKVSDQKPEYGSWVLVTYYMADRDTWRTRIFHWVDANKSSMRKITHWSVINSPSEEL